MYVRKIMYVFNKKSINYIIFKFNKLIFHLLRRLTKILINITINDKLNVDLIAF